MDKIATRALLAGVAYGESLATGAAPAPAENFVAAASQALDLVQRRPVTPAWSRPLVPLRGDRDFSAGALARNGVVAGVGYGKSLDDGLGMSVAHAGLTHPHPVPVLCCCAQTWILSDLFGGWGLGPLSDPSDWLDNFAEDFQTYFGAESDPTLRRWLDANRDGLQEAGETLESVFTDGDDFDPFRRGDSTARPDHTVTVLRTAVWALHAASMAATRAEVGATVKVGMGRLAAVNEPADVLAALAELPSAEGARLACCAAGPLVAAVSHGLPPERLAGLSALDEFDRMFPPDEPLESHREILEERARAAAEIVEADSFTPGATDKLTTFGDGDE